jgi:ribosome-interacting GTPase 1
VGKMTTMEKIAAIQDEMAKTQKNKVWGELRALAWKELTKL